MEPLLARIATFLPLLGTVAGVVFCLYGVNWLLLARHHQLDNERKLTRQLILLGLTLVGVVAITLSLPVSESLRNQVLTLIGVLLSGVIAFSATTIVASFMAGILLRITRPFRTGDFISVAEHFGRVVERGLFDTEIQTEQRELISLPNTYLISHPVAVVRTSGAIISATLSLGYDAHHTRIETLLLDAARQTGLEEPFVQITELADHAITYRVSGLLTEVKSLLSTRSNLYRKVLDTLHGDGVEIVSPGFINQRRLDSRIRVLPPRFVQPPADETSSPEQILFDKAELAEQREQALLHLNNEIHELEDLSEIATGDARARLAELISQKRQQVEVLESSAPLSSPMATSTNGAEDKAPAKPESADNKKPAKP